MPPLQGAFLFTTTTVGSLPKPDWLAEPEKLWPAWRLEGEALQHGTRQIKNTIKKEKIKKTHKKI